MMLKKSLIMYMLARLDASEYPNYRSCKEGRFHYGHPLFEDLGHQRYFTKVCGEYFNLVSKYSLNKWANRICEMEISRWNGPCGMHFVIVYLHHPFPENAEYIPGNVVLEL